MRIKEKQLPTIARGILGIEQRELAYRLEVSRALVSRWESGDRKIGKKYKIKIKNIIRKFVNEFNDFQDR